MKNLTKHKFHKLVEQWKQTPSIDKEELEYYEDFIYQAETISFKSRESLSNHQFVLLFRNNIEINWYFEDEIKLFKNLLDIAINRTGQSDFMEFIFGYNEIMEANFKPTKKVWKSYISIDKKWTNKEILKSLSNHIYNPKYLPGGEYHGMINQFWLLQDKNLNNLSLLKPSLKQNYMQPGEEGRNNDDWV